MEHTDSLFKSIYEELLGVTHIHTAPFPVENAFAEDGTCCALYQEVFDCKIRINDRLNKDEDRDLETVIGNMFEITEIMCKKMFEYGMNVKESCK